MRLRGLNTYYDSKQRKYSESRCSDICVRK